MLLLALVIILEVCQPSQGQSCSVMERCALLENEIGTIDALSNDSDSFVTFECMFTNLPSGGDITWTFNDLNNPPHDIATMAGGSFSTEQETPNRLMIRNVSRSNEGVYSCVLPFGASSTPPTEWCLYVRGRGVFESCGGAPCNTILLSVRSGESVEFDVMVSYRDGGCTNRNITFLKLMKGGVSVYSCSNLGRFHGFPCNSTDNSAAKNISVISQDCASNDCKYNIKLQLENFNAADAGTYVAVVTFELRNIDPASITRMFMVEHNATGDVTTPPATPASGSEAETTTDPTLQPQPVTAGVVAGSTVGAIVAVAVIAALVVALVISLLRKRKSSVILTAINTEEKDDMAENGQVVEDFLTHSMVSMQTGSSEPTNKRVSAMIVQENVVLSGDKNSQGASV